MKNFKYHNASQFASEFIDVNFIFPNKFYHFVLVEVHFFHSWLKQIYDRKPPQDNSLMQALQSGYSGSL